MRKVIIFLVLVLFFSTYIVNNSFADNTINNKELLQRIKQLEEKVFQANKKIAELEEKLSNQEKSVQLKDATIDDLNQHIDAHFLHRIEGYQLLDGLRMGIGATSVFQSVANANGDDLTSPPETVTDLSYSLDLEFEKEFKQDNRAFLHLETGDGAGVEDELQVFSNVNRDADDSDNNLAVTEVWYQHHFNKKSLVLTVGKIDPTVYIDTNQYANDETTQFLGHIFRNSPVIEFPDNSAGVSFGLNLGNFTDIQLLALDANSDWENVGDDLFIASQISFKVQPFKKEGNYRLIGWVDNRNHLKWANPAADKKEGYGFGLSFGQVLVENLSLFGRYGWQNPKVYLEGEIFSLEQAYSLGLELRGSLWGRDNDYIGLAFGQIFPSDDYKKANSVQADSEKHLEVYYSFKANDHLTISPDLQIIWEPYGGDASGGDDPIIVGGLRSQVDF
ncbi:MAG: carbohydrate porin [Candidatus Omnitrophica bacterium]|nr:carbohydrate porin [Candidatus Omnitrophota bacterium]